MDAADKGNVFPDLYPNYPTRQKIAKIDLSKITRMKFSGWDLLHEDDPVELDDKKLIAEFIDALKSAEGRATPVGIMANRLEVYINDEGQGTKAAMFWFYPYRDEDCHGPRFRECLKKLGAYQANEKRALLRDLEDNVGRIELPYWCFWEPNRAREFVRKLADGLQHCYVFTEYSSYKCEVIIHSRDGRRPVTLDLHIARDFDQHNLDYPEDLLEYVAVIRAQRAA